MEIKLPEYKIKSEVREIEIETLQIGGDSSISFMSENNNKTKPVFALEIPYFMDKNYPQILKDYWGKEINEFKSLFFKAQETSCDIICIQFNIEEQDIDSKLDNAINYFKETIKSAKKPLIIKGTNNKNIDKIILAKLAAEITTPVIIAFADDNTYEEIIPNVIKNNHLLVLRSPIDINLAKELNILSIDCGLSADRILIDPDMGALGYGLDYGYSIIEKIRQAAFNGDLMLSMPIITFIGEETFKVKEAKSNNYDKNWGVYEQRAVMWEVATTSAIVSAGANVVVLFHPESIKTLKEILWN